MDKAFEIQKQARQNVKTLQTYLTDLKNWEKEMKRKEAAINGEFEQDLPPVRSKKRKEKPIATKKKPEKRIPSNDYRAWDNFDVDRACHQVDMEEVGPTSLDSKMSVAIKEIKLREEAQYAKEKGNIFVKQEKWDDAIACYTRAIELVKDDAIYFANRGLCFLKKDNLHQAEKDCTEALHIDPTYVKAYQRRATAREKLGSLRAATQDLNAVLKIEPHNAATRKQLEMIIARMGTKGSKSKSSPTTPTTEQKPITEKPKVQPKIVELPPEPIKPMMIQIPKSPLEKWRDGDDENITVIKPVKKPPHLRSKRALKSVPIQEVLLGRTYCEKPPTRLKIIEVEDSIAQEESNITMNGQIDKNIPNNLTNLNSFTNSKGDEGLSSSESEKLITDSNVTEKDVKIENLVAPVNSVQFMSEWKYLKGRGKSRSYYLSLIDPVKIPTIFDNALESDVLSELLLSLHDDREIFAEKTVNAYLKALCRVKRFSTLSMFLSGADKKLLTNLLDHCKTVEKCTQEEISDLKNKYEL